jgi:hypothetical protein
MPLTTVHEWEENEKKYRAVYDEDYQTRGSFAYETEEETKRAEDKELEHLHDGTWIAIGIIVWEKKPHCKECQCPRRDWPWTETDSLWGIVVENDTQAIEEFAAQSM